MVIKKERVSRPHDLASPSVFCHVFTERNEINNQRLNSFVSVLVSLVYW